MQFCTVSLQNWCKRSVFTRSTGCCFEPVATVFYRSGSERFSFLRRLELQLKVQSFPVQSGLSPVFFRSYRPDFKTLTTPSCSLVVNYESGGATMENYEMNVGIVDSLNESWGGHHDDGLTIDPFGVICGLF